MPRSQIDADADPRTLPVTERGAWLATARGGMWSIEHPHPRDVYLDDLAWGMARTCRYAGQIKPWAEFYSVAEHACLMTQWAVEAGEVAYLEDAVALLLHDAAEAFYGDIPTPLKAMMPGYAALENAAQGVILEAFRLDEANTIITKAQIKQIDVRIRNDECLALVAEPALSAGRETRVNKGDPRPLEVQIACHLPGRARRDFIDCFSWCAETLPARDPEVLRAVETQIAGLDHRPADTRPGHPRDPFHDYEEPEYAHETEIAW